MLNKEQAEQIKQQILKQIEDFPIEQRQEVEEQIQAMNTQELEQFLIQNKLIKSQQLSQSAPQSAEQQCIFCSIINNQVPSYKIDENKAAIAILEINPLSKGHSLVISKQHEKLPSSAFLLANKIAKKLKSKLKAEEVKIENSEFQGHQLINIIPQYKNKELKKYKATKDELQEIQNKLIPKKIIQKTAEQKAKLEIEKIKKLPKFPIRIP